MLWFSRGLLGLRGAKFIDKKYFSTKHSIKNHNRIVTYLHLGFEMQAEMRPCTPLKHRPPSLG